MESTQQREPWNKGKLVGQKPPLKPKDIWAIRIHLQNAHAARDLAMFNLAIDSKLRGCDLVSLRVRDITHGNQVLPRAMVIQKKLSGRCSSSGRNRRERQLLSGRRRLSFAVTSITIRKTLYF